MKNKLLHFALDLFSASDDEEQDSIFAQVKIYRTASVSGYSVFEITAGIRGDCGGCYEICGGGSIGGMPFGLETLRYIKMLGLLNSHQHF